MPFNDSGSFSLPGSSFPVVSGAVIDSSKHNNNLNDLASGLSTCVTKDGQTTLTADQPMGGFRHTGVANATSRDGYAALGQVQDNSANWAGTAGGTANAITLTPTPAISTYTAGQSFTYKSGAAANTTAMTVNVSSIAAKAIQKNGAALASGDHPANMWFRITYDGAAFQLEQIAGTSADVTAALALKANLASPTFTGTVTIPTVAIAAGTIAGITDLAIADGGTGASTAAAAYANIKQAATEASSGAIEIATTAEVALGLDTTRAVPAAYLPYHPFLPKAWVTFNGVTGTILASAGVSSVTKASTGRYTINFNFTFANANYSPSGMAEDDDAVGAVVITRHSSDTRTTSAFQFRLIAADAGGAIDSPYICLTFHGER